MYFPTAGIECSPLLPFAAAFSISFFTSMGGISGAFLLLPFQMSILGYTSPGVSATNQAFNVLACPAGVWRYAREGRLLRPLAFIIALGTLPGVFVGAFIRIFWLPDPRDFKLFAAAVLLFIALRLLRDALSSKKTAAQNRTAPTDGQLCHLEHSSLRQLVFSYAGQKHSVRCLPLGLLSLVVGVAGGIYGIGGGAFMAPFLVSFFHLPVHALAGATLFATFLTSLAGMLFYSALGPFFPQLSVSPDWGLGLLLGLGGMAGMYLGARCQRFVPAVVLKSLLVGILLFTAARYLGQSL